MMRRLLLAVTVAALVFAFAPAALAHNFAGGGDCDGWTLQLDGTWNALTIRVDGNAIGLDQTVTIPDTSDDTSRTFTVEWDKAPAGPSRTDVTVTHTLTRELDCEQPPTVTVTCETLTVDAAEGVEWVVWIGDGQVEGEGTQSFQAIPSWFYAVVYNDQVIAEGVFEECSTTTTISDGTTTSTVPPSTTTTQPSETTSTTTTDTSTSTSTSNPAPTTTAPTGSSTPTELPFTGPADSMPLLISAILFLGLGVGVLRSRKHDRDEA